MVEEYPVTENEPVVRMGASTVGFVTLRWAIYEIPPRAPSAVT